MGDEGGTDPAPDGGGELKRVAEIVMVLSAMGEMRGGRGPTAAEKAMAAEARELLVGMCEEVKPKDLFSRDAVRVVVEDLGLNLSMDVVQGVRPPKISIADKLLITKKRMEESKDFATLHSPQPHPVGFGANTESHGTLFHGAPRFLPDRSTPMSLSTGGFQSASSEIHVPDLSSATTSLRQPHVYETQPTNTFVKPSTSHLVKDSPSLTLSHTEAEHFRLDARSAGASYLTQVQAAYAPTKASSTSVQSTPAAAVKLSQENKLLDPTLPKSEGVNECNTFQSSHQVMISQGMQTSIIQTIPGNLLMGHQSSQGITYVQATSYFTNHNDIAKSVQMVLQPKVSGHPNWTPPSIDYMYKALVCQICKIIMNDGESLLVCDACEKGTHLKCLQSFGSKIIPKTDWHCPKCVMVSNGKSFPPKYGRVTRTIATSKVSSNTVGTHVSPEKRAENPDAKVNNKVVPNENLALPYHVYASNMASNHSELASDSKATSAREMQGVDFLSDGMKREDDMCIESSTYPAKERDEAVCASSGTQSQSSDKQVISKGLSSYDMQSSTPESMLESNIVSEQACSTDNQNKFFEDHFQAPSDPQACNSMEARTSVEISENQQHDTSGPSPTALKLCEFREMPKHDSNARPHDWESSQTTPDGAFDSGDAPVDCGRVLSLDLHTVDWVGDILEVIEEKIYYLSCCINGTLHNLQDHVLVSCNSQNLFPSKLQSLWEDKKTGSKWATVDPYYFPGDLPEAVIWPCTPENSEVYALGKRSTIMAGSIRGPCEVLPIDKFRDESDRIQLGDTNNGPHPIFICRWLYDESKGVFQSITK